MSVAYNTRRYQWITIISRDGAIYADKLIDTQSALDMRMLAEFRVTGADRTFVRPAAVAEITGAGRHEVAHRVDAVTVDGELVNPYSGLCKGECVVEVIDSPAGYNDFFDAELPASRSVNVIAL